MKAIDFTESNCVFGPPPDLAESQCRSIPAYRAQIQGGSCDGSTMVVVAYSLSAEEIAALQNGALLYFSMVGGLLPHYPSLSFQDATHPA